MKFIPHPKRIQIVPAQVDSFDSNLLEDYGEVVATGSEVKFVKVGDTIYFDSWGLPKVVIDGVKSFVLLDDPQFILGKLNAENKKPVRSRMATSVSNRKAK